MEEVLSLLSGTRHLLTKHMEKDDIHVLFAPIFTSKVHSQAFQTPEPSSSVLE